MTPPAATWKCKARRFLRRATLALLSPIAEKNPVKACAVDAAIVFSAGRIVILVALYVWARIGIADPQVFTSWPYAVFGIALIVAYPVTEVLQRAPDADVLRLLQAAVEHRRPAL